MSVNCSSLHCSALGNIVTDVEWVQKYPSLCSKQSYHPARNCKAFIPDTGPGVKGIVWSFLCDVLSDKYNNQMWCQSQSTEYGEKCQSLTVGYANG